jgi:hypothetical protein
LTAVSLCYLLFKICSHLFLDNFFDTNIFLTFNASNSEKITSLKTQIKFSDQRTFYQMLFYFLVRFKVLFLFGSSLWQTYTRMAWIAKLTFPFFRLHHFIVCKKNFWQGDVLCPSINGFLDKREMDSKWMNWHCRHECLKNLKDIVTFLRFIEDYTILANSYTCFY